MWVSRERTPGSQTCSSRASTLFRNISRPGPRRARSRNADTMSDAVWEACERRLVLACSSVRSGKRNRVPCSECTAPSQRQRAAWAAARRRAGGAHVEGLAKGAAERGVGGDLVRAGEDAVSRTEEVDGLARVLWVDLGHVFRLRVEEDEAVPTDEGGHVGDVVDCRMVEIGVRRGATRARPRAHQR